LYIIQQKNTKKIHHYILRLSLVPTLHGKYKKYEFLNISLLTADCGSISQNFWPIDTAGNLKKGDVCYAQIFVELILHSFDIWPNILLKYWRYYKIIITYLSTKVFFAVSSGVKSLKIGYPFKILLVFEGSEVAFFQKNLSIF